MKKNFLFTWQGINQQGDAISGELSAPTLNLAKYHFVKQEITLTHLIQQKKIHFTTRSKIQTNDFILFFRQLSTLLIAAVPIIQAFLFLSRHKEHHKLKTLLTSITHDLQNGHPLSFGLSKFPHYFDSITCSLIEVGERSGTLDVMLERITHYKEQSAALKMKIRQALFYPALTSVFALIISFLMLTCVVPRFAELFQTMHCQLPLLTRFILAFASRLRQESLWLMLTAIGCWYIMYRIRRNPAWQIYVDQMLLRIPLFGNQLRRFIWASIARSLAVIFAAGIPISEALRMISHTTGNLIYQHALEKIQLDIAGGKQFNVALRHQSDFPSLFQQLVEVGEESGTLDQMLAKIADYYENDMNYFISQLGSLLEPLIMIILGVLIGGLVIALYLPIFQLGTVI